MSPAFRPLESSTKLLSRSTKPALADPSSHTQCQSVSIPTTTHGPVAIKNIKVAVSLGALDGLRCKPLPLHQSMRSLRQTLTPLPAITDMLPVHPSNGIHQNKRIHLLRQWTHHFLLISLLTSLCSPAESISHPTALRRQHQSQRFST